MAFRNRLFILAVLLYAIFTVPAYLIFVGPVADVGTITPDVAIGGLVIGGILFVPMIHAYLEKHVENIAVRAAFDSFQ